MVILVIFVMLGLPQTIEEGFIRGAPLIGTIRYSFILLSKILQGWPHSLT